MIQIVTDTASDISAAEARQLGVDVVKLSVMFGDTPYDQMQDENFDTFYQMLDTCKELPVTSQPSPDAFLTVFKAAKEAGNEVIAILLSSKLSGTVQSAFIAREMSGHENSIHVIDSGQAITGQRLLVEYAVRLRDEGKSAGEIVAIIREAGTRIRLFGALNTLKYLRKGGRIPATAEMIGTVMGIKPLVKLEDGQIQMAGKARGHAGAVTNMVKLVEECPRFDDTAPVYFGYTDTPKQLVAFRQLCVQRYNLNNTVTCPIGSVIGTHVGPGAFAITCLVKD